jgi:hypothetical protein
MKEALGMAWLVAGLSRLALILVWIFTPYVGRAFDGGFWGWFLPLIGVLFFPVTVLAYLVVNELAGGVTGWSWVWIVLAFLVDTAAHSAGVASTRRRYTRYGSA